MDLIEFRQEFINEDVFAEAVNTNRYPEVVFIDHCVDILQNDYSLISDMTHSFFAFKEGTRAFKNMQLDASYLDLAAGTLNLLIADFNEGEIKNITNTTIENKTKLLLSYLENTLKGFFKDAEQSDPAVQLAREIRRNIDAIHTVHLFIVSTDKLSTSVKTLELDDFSFGAYTFKVVRDVLDIEKIFRSKMAGFEKEDLVINCSDFGIKGIPCIKAEIETDQYDSYLAIVPGPFLAEIYKKHGPTLLESNVRSFLKFNGGVNKGIRGTILNEKSRFFTYNNGISTTAKSVETTIGEEGLMITSFTDLQIINGGQTTATLAATNIKNNADLSGIFVQMKLTVLKEDDPELIRNIATYANSQNKVKTADLNSSHPFYVRIEDFSRKIYAPLASGQLVQQLWFFERARGQYEQPLMQMTKKQRDDYKLVRPKDKKFTLTDLSKYMNAADMLPHYVSWGGEVNAAHFHNNMLKQWNKDNSVFNELFYKELIGKKIFFAYSFCPCFEHSQKVISMIVYFDDELKFKEDEKNHKKLLNLIRRYSFIYEKANLNDICNWFVFFYEYKISLLKHSEDVLLENVIAENNPIILANYLIYSQYDKTYNSTILQEAETIIDNNISNMIPYEPLLQREFWYVLIFCNCPYISTGLKAKLQSKVNEIHCTGTSPCDKANNLIFEFLRTNQSNLFFYWGYYHFNTSKQLTYRTYQRTLFKQYKNKHSVELYGSLDS